MQNIEFIGKEITLPMILKQIEQEGKYLCWSIFSLQVMGDLGDDKPIPEFQRKVEQTWGGYLLTWDELCAMSHKFWIVIDFVLVGCKDTQTIINLTRKYNTSEEIFPHCEIAVEIDDGDFLNIYAKNPKVVEKVIKKFGSLPVGVYRPLNKG